jgi:hypothetical protein
MPLIGKNKALHDPSEQPPQVIPSYETSSSHEAHNESSVALHGLTQKVREWREGKIAQATEDIEFYRRTAEANLGLITPKATQRANEAGESGDRPKPLYNAIRHFKGSVMGEFDRPGSTPQRASARTIPQEVASWRHNLRAQAIRKRQMTRNKYTGSLKAFGIEDFSSEESLEREIETHRFKHIDKNAIRGAYRQVNKADRSISRIHGRLERASRGKDLASIVPKAKLWLLDPRHKYRRGTEEEITAPKASKLVSFLQSYSATKTEASSPPESESTQQNTHAGEQATSEISPPIEVVHPINVVPPIKPVPFAFEAEPAPTHTETTATPGVEEIPEQPIAIDNETAPPKTETEQRQELISTCVEESKGNVAMYTTADLTSDEDNNITTAMNNRGLKTQRPKHPTGGNGGWGEYGELAVSENARSSIARFIRKTEGAEVVSFVGLPDGRVEVRYGLMAPGFNDAKGRPGKEFIMTFKLSKNSAASLQNTVVGNQDPALIRELVKTQGLAIGIPESTWDKQFKPRYAVSNKIDLNKLILGFPEDWALTVLSPDGVKQGDVPFPKPNSAS